MKMMINDNYDDDYDENNDNNNVLFLYSATSTLTTVDKRQ